MDTMPEWMEALPSDLQESKSLARIPDVETLAKNVLEKDKMIDGSIRLPGEDDDSKSKFAERVSALGFAPKEEVPETYELNGVGDEDFEKTFLDERRKYYKEAGLTQKQAEKALEIDSKGLDDYRDTLKATTQTLKNEYGEKLEAKLKNADKVVEKYDLKKIAESPLGATPEWNKFMIEIGEQFGEDGKIAGEGTTEIVDTEALEIEEAELNAEMSKLMQAGKLTEGHPEAVAHNLKRQAFLAKKHGMKKGERFAEKTVTVTG